MKALLIFAVLFLVASQASASRNDFCEGFEMGYKTVMGNNVIVPICPIAPMTPLGSTDYQEGIKAGMEAAQ